MLTTFKASKLTKVVLAALPLVLASQVQAADGTISFTGNVSASTCNVAIAGVTTNPNATVSVVLPTVNTAVLAKSGDVAGATPFTISVSACNGTATSFTTLFTPVTGDANTNGKLVNKTSTGGATNVVLEILAVPTTGSAATVNLSATTAANQQSNSTATTTLSGNAGTQNYRVQYSATGIAGPGAVTASLPFTISYN